MASNLKNYPATEEKIQELRASGFLPRSKDLLIAALFIGISFSILKLLLPQLFSLKTIIDPHPEDFSIYTKNFFSFFFKLALVNIFLPILILIWGLGLLQNKFYFNFGLLSLRFVRLFALPKFFSEFNKRILSIFMAFCFLAVGVFCFKQLSNFYIANMAKYFQQLDFSKAFPEIFQEAFGKQNNLIIFILFVVFVLGIIARFISILLYQREHSMSRDEVEAEMREQEMAPGMKRLFRE